MANRRSKFTTFDPKEITVKQGVSVPRRLKPVVSNAPEVKAQVDVYLRGLISAGVITQDDVTFLLESGALE